MAFDKATRNALAKMVGESRRLLTEDIRNQLQAVYGLQTDGSALAVERLTHLDETGRDVARELRHWQQHLAFTEIGPETQRKATAFDRVVGETAFTILNRLAALRMCEEREHVVECVRRGMESDGFQIYERLLNGALGTRSATYRIFLERIFDELAVDLGVLFALDIPQSLVFPSEVCLEQVLAELNTPTLAHLWREDETIGWIYQYFNSREERRQMREASAAPRNSRELAVRNQFFTPSYVVEFLVDNTLGRLWFNCTGGATSLRDRCQYLLVTPNETSAAPSRRDPRTLRFLDPACGSMHFGLYAFNLFLHIYEEAWDWEQQNGPGSLFVPEDEHGKVLPLSQLYADRSAFVLDLPRLIVRHNLYGVEIDPRAAQIASLALWLRAQRAWHELGVRMPDRPVIGVENVVAAIAPPMEPTPSSEIGQLDRDLLSKTLQLLQGLPELGILLKVERNLPVLIRQLYGEHGPLLEADDRDQWQEAEVRLRSALSELSGSVQASYLDRLFVHDALEGLKIIDLAELKFDVIVMNPPFGEISAGVKDVVRKEYPFSKNDLLGVFVERGIELLRANGRLGAITSRTCFFLTSFQAWREQVLLGMGEPEIVADLGFGVMDDAVVEAAAFTVGKR